jgi:IclR family acetate operon transcriptional repressor
VESAICRAAETLDPLAAEADLTAINACGAARKQLPRRLHLCRRKGAVRALNRLAVDLGLNKASLHHTLSVLRHRGFVEQDSNGNYRLGRAALSLA